MGEANVFNTFSFNQWAEKKKDEEIDNDSREKNREKIRQLREKLRKEKELREAGGDGELDIDSIIRAIQMQKGIEIPDDPHDDMVIIDEEEETSYSSESKSLKKNSQSFKYSELTEQDLLSEIYSSNIIESTKPPVKSYMGEGSSIAGLSKKDWNYNRRFVYEEPDPPRKSFKKSRASSFAYRNK